MSTHIAPLRIRFFASLDWFRVARHGLPWVVLALGGAIAVLLARGPGASVSPEVTPPLPTVEVVSVAAQAVAVVIETHGTIEPRVEIDLAAELAGRVVRISPKLVAGGLFEPGDVLVELDARDRRDEVERLAARVDRGHSALLLAEEKRERMSALEEAEFASAATLSELDHLLRVAAADLRESRAELARARRDLARAKLRAPFQGRVRSAAVDVDSYVTPGEELARIYAVDSVEVRLPVRVSDLAYLELPPAGGSSEVRRGPRVELAAESMGAQHTWVGEVLRVEAEIAVGSRMAHLVARIDEPYGPDLERAREQPLAGRFVEARIRGRRLEGVFVLPATALAGADLLTVVDAADRVRERRVEVLRHGDERVVVGDGLEPGDRVCVPALVDALGLVVRTRLATGSSAALHEEAVL